MSVVQIYGPAFSTFVRSVMMVCEEKGIEYQVEMALDGEAIGYRSPEHRALQPWAKFPIIRHDELTLYETQVICFYLDELNGKSKLLPDGLEQRAMVMQWCAAISSYIDKALVRDYLLEFMRPKGEKGAVRMDRVAEAVPKVVHSLEILSEQLGAQAFLCGKLPTVADFLLLPMLDYLAGLPQGAELIQPDSVLADYLQRLRTRPSAAKVLGSR